MSIDNPINTHRRSAILQQMTSLVLASLIGVGVLVCLSFFFFACIASEIEDSNVAGPAPNASYAILGAAWGQENLQHHFVRVDEWVRQSTQIADDIGTVTGVAPIGSPNRFHSYFGESSASMNLEIIGEKGVGTLCLRDVGADDPENLYGVNLEEWTFKRTKLPERLSQ